MSTVTLSKYLGTRSIRGLKISCGAMLERLSESGDFLYEQGLDKVFIK
jgi:hypothetical protein